LIGTEFSGAVFIDPVLWKLADEDHAEAIRSGTAQFSFFLPLSSSSLFTARTPRCLAPH
jgi:hypothetical protein